MFVTDQPVSLKRLSDVLGISVDDTAASVQRLEESLAGRGIRLQRHGELLQLVSAPEAAEAVEQFLGLDSAARLSTAAVETLAVVAYQQPVTRSQVEQVRGVNSDRAVATLLARGLIEEVGRSESIGRPALFGTTVEFLEHLGLGGLDSLPALPAAEPVPERAES